ncbi:MAG: Kdo hydroxylase family protein [Terriglobales bacterium]
MAARTGVTIPSWRNVSYRPRQDRLTGLEGEGREPMRALMRRFSREAPALIQGLLSPYELVEIAVGTERTGMGAGAISC